MTASVVRHGQGYRWSCDDALCARTFSGGGVFSGPDIEGARIMQRQADEHDRAYHAVRPAVSAHLTSPVARLGDDGHFIGWYPYCATCDRYGARVRDEDLAAQVCASHEAQHAA